MSSRRRKDLAAIRRRVQDDGDEETCPEIEELDDDSLSDDSTHADESDLPEECELEIPLDSEKVGVNGFDTNDHIHSVKDTPEVLPKVTTSLFNKRTATMDMMLNGLKLTEEIMQLDAVSYEDLREDELQTSSRQTKSTAKPGKQPLEALHERRRREHEEYKKRRDEDPAFVPNRGAFFMHDHRHSGPAANGFRPFGRGRGRSRPGHGAISSASNKMPVSIEPPDAPWTHDKHEAIADLTPENLSTTDPTLNCINPHSRTSTLTSQVAPPNRALSATKSLGNVLIRVALPAMLSPIIFSGIPVKQYTRLPDHRPPLRRDKPVRISLPKKTPRYIFPPVDRSFIFIPRAMRPNQQGFGNRGRGRSILGSAGGYSRRTSVFGGSLFGSAYSPSIVMSRRSSLGKEVNRDNLTSPNHSTISKTNITNAFTKPVVRLPPAQDIPQPKMAQQTDNKSVQDSQQHKSPSIPTLNKHEMSSECQDSELTDTNKDLTIEIPMHQPRPHKTVSVADIESPTILKFNPPQQQQQQPFHHQVPAQVNENIFSFEPGLHSRNASYPSQTSTGTPLSQIPERAIHAQPFQPNLYPSQQFYPQPCQIAIPPQGYYFPHPFASVLPSSGGTSPFIPSSSLQVHAPQSSQENQCEETTPLSGVQNLVVQEVNGMVYYYDAAQLPAISAFSTYQPPPPSYPAQQVGMTGMGVMAPNNEGFYYAQAPPGSMYYPQ
ncbi:hypothetical protein BGHDH14_bgh02913 [Blumeria hordei DH14]|uniref:Btz domain-containing protein n=1 Tax=Blumeria graminis f. sp. hordei (strain DH14) TaxID=546991 RepID=N1JC47_BLUG1|nr:hypothetical protein BGHDH14_bgh02913 [Blumeria hordei DH14]